MSEAPLTIPLLIAPSHVSPGDPLPIRPTQITEWTTTTPAGPSRHVALCSRDNTIWFHTSPQRPLPSPSVIPPPPTQLLPTITKTASSSPSRRSSGAPTRDRGGSFASSIITTTSTSSRRRHVPTFSPPPNGRTAPSAVVTSATALPAGPDAHIHSANSTVDLRDQLREQGRQPVESGVGLGIAGLGRRLNVAGKEELEGGATSPRSTASFESSRTVSNRWNWFRDDAGDQKLREEELKEKIEEVEVDREMERESRADQKEKEEQQLVERAGTPTVQSRSTGAGEMSTTRVKRLLLPRWTEGKVVCMRLFQSVGLLAVLRDHGLLDLISLDTLEVVNSIDLEMPEGKHGESSKHTLSAFWAWRCLHLARSEESSFILADGVPWPCGMPSPNGEVTRVAMISDHGGQWDVTARLELPGLGHIGVCEHTNVNYLLHFLPFSLTSYPIKFPSSPDPSPGPSRQQTPVPRAISSVFPSPLLRAPTPSQTEKQLRRNRSFASLTEEKEKEKEKDKGFAKFLARRNVPQSSETSQETRGRIGEGKEVERDGYGDWNIVRVAQNGEGIGVRDGMIDVFTCDGTHLAVKGTVSTSAKSRIQDVLAEENWSNILAISNEDTIIHRAVPQRDGAIKFDQVTSLPNAECASLGSNGDFLVAYSSSLISIDPERSNDQTTIVTLDDPKASAHLAAVHPCGVGAVFVADHAGNIRQQSLDSVIAGIDSEEAGVSVDRLDSPITVIRTIRWQQKDLLVVGDEDGVIRIWTTKPFEQQGSWTVFADSVHQVALLDMPQAGVLQNCLLCTSREGTVALISLADMEHLFIIPASRAPLCRVFIENKDILLAYSNGKARVWNIQTCEFRRSTGLDAAEDMIASGDWVEVDLDRLDDSKSVLRSSTHSISPDGDLARLVNVDLRAVTRWVHSARAEHPTPLAFLRTLLSMLVPFGVNEMMDEFCTDKLGITKPNIPVNMGQADSETASFYAGNGPDAWRASPVVTGLRQLALVSLLRPFLDAPDSEQYAAEVMAFYAGSLPDAVEAGLDFFAGYYMDSSGDVHQAARMLFKARLARMSEVDIEAVVSAAQGDLPSLQSGPAQRSQAAAQALTLIGGIALDKYQSINPSALKVAADSVFLYLSDPSSPHLALAIELASAGFTTWQSYIDPMDLLRLLFHLATHTPPPTAMSAQARLAVLHIATINPPLFMSTLSMDILDAKTVEGRTSIMKLCVFMARKRPGVIQNHLPRIAEAVVKSLDPNVGKMRDDVQEAATVILNELVLAFSTIDFHSGTQRLAVGTGEGAVIMYDLKSASRLYVIEPHTSPVSSVTFSPDGRRLVTVSLEGGDLTVWKVGSSLSGFFNVGGPPRQGGVKGEPYKRIVFKRADDGPLEETSALSDVRIEWLEARQVRVSIRETALTFET